MKKRSLQILLLCLLTSVLSGCNTFHGFGEDVSHLGNAISRVAE
ncbi:MULTISPECIES: entericidin A/B family lipoprotein [Tatumella]|uniref:Entericidin A/B family lipoprotein n=1 Tax=Tatumella punctata TaxID=399969 RepID=A0ABW1VLV4_9GAMM|nr:MULTISPECIES: entericidin A/B family lipoprotein [unclassified Tatumella]MBS0855467.1 entericidin A/B family lipoprotein [Tatumella sp. JGM16]MBS0877161.1 entericidin A/B family lipoprotein [Tatumella sp. JGM82]MBS0890571.1 entericidin A/B family lipoprotein [Tatumella sp. JGM94]MBS0893244.1 entericidin A/B family lipoprotein [Tatumella sp. JGM130]MBS0901464.1 entericidin A/B family lipoprotein [Tatumella sp. JGM100]